MQWTSMVQPACSGTCKLEGKNSTSASEHYPLKWDKAPFAGMAGTCLFWGKRLCLLALLPVIDVPGAGHAVHENSTLCSAQRPGTVPHCREDNSSGQLHFKLRKILISGRIVFSTGCCMSLQLLLPVQRSSLYCQQIVLLQRSIRVRVQWIHLSFSTSGKFFCRWGMLSIPRLGQQAQPAAGLPAPCAVPDCPLPESVGCTACSSSAAGPFPPRAKQCCQL